MHGESDVFKNRFILYKTEVLKDNAHGAAELRNVLGLEAGHLIVAHHDFTGIGLFLVHNHFYKGAFSGARSSHYKDKLTLIYFQVNVVQGFCTVVISLIDAAKFYERRFRRSAFRHIFHCPFCCVFLYNQDMSVTTL